MFIPATIEECDKLNWRELDVVLVTGDSYIDSPYSGIAIIGKLLIKHGYRVAIIPQPNVNSAADIMRFGAPKLFWGVTSGAMDSMVANYTATKKYRNNDDLTAGGINNKRPDRALIKYVNTIQRFSSKKKPIIIGGIEASLRRIAHYDFWDNKLRRSILLDSKADILVYGEGERTIIEIAEKLKNNHNIDDVRGICYITNATGVEFLAEYTALPTFEEVQKDENKFIKMFDIFYQNNDPLNAVGLIQQTGNRYIVQNPPNFYLENAELDEIYDMKYANAPHFIHKQDGKIKAIDTIKYSITSHRGCFGECNFCAIAVHQGRRIRSRSQISILKEIHGFLQDKNFNGNVKDIGGATANMYGMSCDIQQKHGVCKNKRCIFPTTCKHLKNNHVTSIKLLQDASKISGIKKIFITSGIRFDMVLADKISGEKYLQYVVKNCVSGQMKIAPEHTQTEVLELMGKPKSDLKKFYMEFMRLSKLARKNQFLTYYLIESHPGCTKSDMQDMFKYMSKELSAKPEQIQMFTPTPSTYSTLMYYTKKLIKYS